MQTQFPRCADHDQFLVRRAASVKVRDGRRREDRVLTYCTACRPDLDTNAIYRGTPDPRPRVLDDRGDVA